MHSSTGSPDRSEMKLGSKESAPRGAGTAFSPPLVSSRATLVTVMKEVCPSTKAPIQKSQTQGVLPSHGSCGLVNREGGTDQLHAKPQLPLKSGKRQERVSCLNANSLSLPLSHLWPRTPATSFSFHRLCEAAPHLHWALQTTLPLDLEDCSICLLWRLFHTIVVFHAPGCLLLQDPQLGSCLSREPGPPPQLVPPGSKGLNSAYFTARCPLWRKVMLTMKRKMLMCMRTRA